MKIPIPGFKLRKHFSVYFKLYQEAFSDVYGPGPGNFNPRKLMRLEILQAYLQNRNPNWVCATFYISPEEAERRNKTYKKP